jgi:hypothetical protein
MRTLIGGLALLAAVGAGAALAFGQSSPRHGFALTSASAHDAAMSAPGAAASATPETQDETPVPSTGASPAAEQAAQPQPSPTPAYRFIWRPTPAPEATANPGPNAPEIREIDLGDQTLVTPGELRVRVVTSRDVVSVTARTLGREIGIPRQDVGLFALSGMVPQVPAFLADRTYDVDFVAAVRDGRTAVVTLPLALK